MRQVLDLLRRRAAGQMNHASVDAVKFDESSGYLLMLSASCLKCTLTFTSE